MSGSALRCRGEYKENAPVLGPVLAGDRKRDRTILIHIRGAISLYTATPTPFVK